MPSHVVVVVAEVAMADVQSKPHITGQCVSANSWCTPPTLQSAVGIRVPQLAGSSTPWHGCGRYAVVVAVVVAAVGAAVGGATGAAVGEAVGAAVGVAVGAADGDAPSLHKSGHCS